MYHSLKANGLLVPTTTVSAQQTTLTEQTTIHLSLVRDAAQQRTEARIRRNQSHIIAAGKRLNLEFRYALEILDTDIEEVKDE